MIDNKRKKRNLAVRKYSSLVLIDSISDNISKLCSWSLCALAIAPCLAAQQSLTHKGTCLRSKLFIPSSASPNCEQEGWLTQVNGWAIDCFSDMRDDKF